jgi:hypothetical protein
LLESTFLICQYNKYILCTCNRTSFITPLYHIFSRKNICRSSALAISKLNSQIYDKQDQQEKAAFNERNHHTIKQQEPATMRQDDPKQKQDTAEGRARTG